MANVFSKKLPSNFWLLRLVYFIMHHLALCFVRKNKTKQKPTKILKMSRIIFYILSSLPVPNSIMYQLKSTFSFAICDWFRSSYLWLLQEGCIHPKWWLFKSLPKSGTCHLHWCTIGRDKTHISHVVPSSLFSLLPQRWQNLSKSYLSSCVPEHTIHIWSTVRQSIPAMNKNEKWTLFWNAIKIVIHLLLKINLAYGD